MPEARNRRARGFRVPFSLCVVLAQWVLGAGTTCFQKETGADQCTTAHHNGRNNLRAAQRSCDYNRKSHNKFWTVVPLILGPGKEKKRRPS